MFQHNLLIIYRNFKRFKSAFFINLIGLSTGLACIADFLWVRDELKVDHFHEKDDQLYQVMQNVSHSDGIETIEATSGLLAKALADEMPEVEYTTAVIPSFWNSSKGVISRNDTRIKVKGQYASKIFLMYSRTNSFKAIGIKYYRIGKLLLYRLRWQRNYSIQMKILLVSQ